LLDIAGHQSRAHTAARDRHAIPLKRRDDREARPSLAAPIRDRLRAPGPSPPKAEIKPFDDRPDRQLLAKNRIEKRLRFEAEQLRRGFQDHDVIGAGGPQQIGAIGNCCKPGEQAVRREQCDRVRIECHCDGWAVYGPRLNAQFRYQCRMPAMHAVEIADSRRPISVVAHALIMPAANRRVQQRIV
jgi:hypothetical protein